MKGHIYTIEELMLDDSFVSYCLSTGAAVSSHWKTIIRNNPKQEKTFDEAKNLVLALHGGLSRPEMNRQIEEVRRQLQQRKKEEIVAQPGYEPPLSSAFVVTEAGHIKRRVFQIAVSYAAVACIIIAVAWWFFSQSASYSSENQMAEVQAGN